MDEASSASTSAPPESERPKRTIKKREIPDHLMAKTKKDKREDCTKMLAPTAEQAISKHKHEIDLLKARVEGQSNVIKELQSERDFLRQQVASLTAAKSEADKKGETITVEESDSSTDGTTLSLSSSIISGQKKSKWLDTFSKCSVKTVPVQVYIDNQEQVDAIYSHLSSILDSTPMHMHSDKVKFIMDVLFPESIICALAFVENLSIPEAEEKFLRGPVIDLSEREHFDRRIEQHFSEDWQAGHQSCHTLK
ncbi:hypothetical protein QQF64_026176 [Cirrhinus molitorella]|uniref:PWWP domain-containing protein n=1 Tax=Cirrhinus molitorella TaxID=172907 RepID=A0ABR3NS60_9TELE